MKCIIIFLAQLIMYSMCYGQKVGIGTLSPDLKLTIEDDGGLVAKGEFGSGALLKTSGFGSRFIWYPRKGAIRAGVIDVASDGSNWNDLNIGEYSMAIGRNTKALGSADIALGSFCEASGGSSIAMGNSSHATGYISTAIGYGLQAIGQLSFAANIGNQSRGFGSACFGNGNIAKGFATFTIGQYNDPILATDQPSASDGTMNTPLFIIGNGATEENRSNAMVTIRNGETGFGKTPNATGSFTDAKVQIRGKANNDILRLETPAGDKFWSLYVNSGNAGLQFFYNGNFRGSFDTISGNYIPVSDRRMKKDISPIAATLGNLLQLEPYSYRYIANAGDGPLTYGFMAQDIQRFFPNLVREVKQRDGNNILTLDYTGLHAVAFKAIQEQNSIIKAQQEKIEMLENKLINIEKMLSGR